MLATTVPDNYIMPILSQFAEKAGGMHVLVVDEDAAVRAACCEIVSGLGYLPHGAESPASGRVLLRNHGIDILLLDLKGPVGGQSRTARRDQGSSSGDGGGRHERLCYRAFGG
jgi:hypothetical protein